MTPRCQKRNKYKLMRVSSNRAIRSLGMALCDGHHPQLLAAAPSRFGAC
jgi:hypothetical protein